MNNTCASAREILILGFGSPLMGDDGLGPAAVEMLNRRSLPAGVQIADAGVPGWDLPNWLMERGHVWLVDAVQMGASPGEWRRLEPEEVKLFAGDSFLSLHEPGLANGLALAEALHLLPEEIVLYALEPVRLAGQSLSPVVEAALPGLVDRIVEDLWKRMT